jgi:hypothetical protein
VAGYRHNQRFLDNFQRVLGTREHFHRILNLAAGRHKVSDHAGRPDRPRQEKSPAPLQQRDFSNSPPQP